MKMKLNIQYILLVVAGVFSMTACSDFLDKEPDERVSLDNEESIIKLIGTSYTEGDYGWLCELSSDNMIDNNAPHYPANKNTKQDSTIFYKRSPYGREDDEVFAFKPVKSSTGMDTPSSVWQSAYNAIATANHGLQAINDVFGTDNSALSERIRAAKGEALLCRAYHHFLLVNIFSKAYKDAERSKQDIGIPYMTTIETTVSPRYDRGNVADVYAKIQRDLEEGLSLISDVNFNQAPKYHFNVSAANAFAARFYLHIRDYEKVIYYADLVLGTDREALVKDLMDYSVFNECTYSSDFANKWKDPSCKNNLMLLNTGSGAWRRFGGRYACNSIPLRCILYRSGPTWGWTIMPTYMASGLFGSSEYGIVSSKVAEHFEYADKVAQTGYVHQIRREFTRTLLLLDRAEAYLLGRHDKESCLADLAAYEKGRQTFSEEDYKHYYADGNGLKDLTRDMIDKESGYSYQGYYAKGTRGYRYSGLNENCYENWDFARNMGITMNDDEIPFMNAVNDYRRCENAFEGFRFFDVKRWGIEYTHRVGYSDRKHYDDLFLGWDDPRRAIELPQEVIAAGLAPSRPGTEPEPLESGLMLRSK